MGGWGGGVNLKHPETVTSTLPLPSIAETRDRDPTYHTTTMVKVGTAPLGLEIAHWSRAWTALTEDQSLVPSTHNGQLTTARDSSSKGSETLF